MKKLLFLGACLVALASQPVMAQTSGSDIVIVKLREDFNYLEIFIARPGSKPEYRLYRGKELDELGNGKIACGTAEFTRRLFVELTQQGYSLTTTYGGGIPQTPTTLVFTKKQ